MKTPSAPPSMIKHRQKGQASQRSPFIMLHPEFPDVSVAFDIAISKAGRMLFSGHWPPTMESGLVQNLHERLTMISHQDRQEQWQI